MFSLPNNDSKDSKSLNFFCLFILLGIIFLLLFKNYTAGTILIGWDSLHPEFNFPEAFTRTFDGVWRSEQGVGALGAHGDIADLPRVVFVWLLSFVVSTSFLRYAYFFACLVLGPLGVYFFLKYILRKESENLWIYPSALLGALYYLLNLSTLQNFYVPLEMFPTAFAFAPWLIFYGSRYLKEGGKLNLGLWFLLLIVSSPMAYAATLWYATFAGLFIFFAGYTLTLPNNKSKFKRLLVLGIFAFLLNSYWILPNAYSIANQSKTISNSNINRLFSPEAFLRNRDSGTISNIILQKNFLFGWRNFDFSTNQFVDLLGVWTQYLNTSNILLLGYLLSSFSVLGVLFVFIKREKTGLVMLPAFLFAMFFLININPPTGGIYSYLYSHFNVFAEGFRMPFTKFSILFQLFSAYYFGYFIYVLLSLKNKYLLLFKPLAILFTAFGLVYFMLPAFAGELVSPMMMRQMPDSYTKVFDWFDKNSQGRVALFPINSKYGWEYRDWGYEGSGFLTYGIKNPVLYRDFDRWHSANEDFFNQLSFSLYSDDSKGVNATLQKYQVKYLLLDESIVNPGGSDEVLKIAQIKKIFNENKNIRQVEKLGFLTIYETDYDDSKYGINAPKTLSQVNTNLSYSPVDPIYVKYGNYIESEGEQRFPFINLESRGPVEIKINPPNIIFENASANSTLSIPAKDVLYENLSINRGFPSAYNCDLKKIGSVFKSNSGIGILYKAEGGGASCDYIGFSQLKYNQAYVMRIAGKNIDGRGLKFYLFNQFSQIPELEEVLPSGSFDKTFFVYPKNIPDGGYVLNFETRSFGRISSENLVSKIEFYPVDYATLQGENLQGAYSMQNSLDILDVTKYTTTGYKVKIKGGGILQLGQGYEEGWLAFTFDPNTWQVNFLEHKKINSWANGWIVPNDNTPFVYIFFWPQLLEWLGFALALTSLAHIFKRKK